MKTSNWNKDLSEKYRKVYIEKEFICRPAIIKITGDVKNKKILDLGCGNGYYSRLFAKMGAKVVGVDASKAQIKLARSMEAKTPLGIDYYLSDITDIRKLKLCGFDIVLLSMVILDVGSKTKAKRIFKEASFALRKHGALVMMEVNPHIINFRIKTRYIKMPKNYNYFKKYIYKAILTLMDNTKMILTNTHWRLEEFSEFLKASGFVITDILEPKLERDERKYGIRVSDYRIPIYVLIKAEKVS